MDFSENSVTLPSGTMSYRVAGTGPVVVYLSRDGAPRISVPLQALAETYTVIVPVLAPIEGTPRSKLAERLAEFVAAVARDKVDVIGHGAGARIAAWLAVRHSDKLDALVLVAPEDFARPDIQDELAAELPKIGCLTLIIAGNADTLVPADALRLLKQRIRRSFLVYVHDAGHDVEIDRPKQFLRAVGDFLHWGEGFLVRRTAA